MMHIPYKIISGGQTGADLGALVGARRCGIETGGAAPRGYKTEVGDKPEELKRYGLISHASPNYKHRTLDNIKKSDVTIIFSTKPSSSGTKLTVSLCRKENKPFILITDLNAGVSQEVIDFISVHKPVVINVAGNRESVSPGLTKLVASYIQCLFQKKPNKDLYAY